MKKLTLLISALLISLLSVGDGLILVDNDSPSAVKDLFTNDNILIHHYSDDLIIATELMTFDGPKVVLDQNPWQNGKEYFIARFDKTSRSGYLSSLENLAQILYENDGITVIAVEAANVPSLYPAVHGGLVRIPKAEAKLPRQSQFMKSTYSSPQADIYQMMSEVDTVNLESYVQHLQDYGTRNAYSSQAVQAQNWIYDQFTSFGLDVELHDFSMPGGNASDNVIATLTGTKHPDEYVILGAHYDSYAFSGSAPGADDNASGTAGILEAARIMSQYSFDRSIIFAAWGGEEYGLYGSEAWASEKASEGMNILGYFNMDMAGYRHPGDEIHTDIIAPSSAQELVDFYINTCAIYLPDFEVYEGYLSGGDSDHTSFNNNGFMGIFPFEDDNNHSPYIHSPDDVIGLSVNSFEMHSYFTKAIIANVATMSDQLPSPQITSAVAGDEIVDLVWSSVDSVSNYYVYRNDDTIPFASITDTMWQDTAVENMTPYTYYVTAVFMNTGEESQPSNVVTVVPMPPIALPFLDEFETGGYYWSREDTWGLKEGVFYSPSNSMTESPDGNYGDNMSASATLRSVDLSNAINAELSFWSKYQIEANYDYMYLEFSTDGNSWETIDIFTGTQSAWAQNIYLLDEYIGEETFFVRFRFESDVYVNSSGMNIDDFMIYADGVGIKEQPESPFSMEQNNPNPFRSFTRISFYLEKSSRVDLEIFDAAGKKVYTALSENLDQGAHSYDLDGEDLQPGFYYYSLSDGSTRVTKRMIRIR